MKDHGNLFHAFYFPVLEAAFFSRVTVYDIQYLPVNENLSKFHRDIIYHWRKINSTDSKTKGDVLKPIILNYPFISVNRSFVGK